MGLNVVADKIELEDRNKEYEDRNKEYEVADKIEKKMNKHFLIYPT